MDTQKVNSTIKNLAWSNICEKDFANKMFQKRTFNCEKCDKTFTRKWNRTQHVKVMHDKITSYRSYKCPECDKMFGLKVTLKDHLSNAHEKINDDKCNICDKSFAK